MMRIIVAGSRSAEEAQVQTALRRCPWIRFASAIVSGTAKGADVFGEKWAQANGIAVIRCPAEWDKYGKRAGPMRNATMAERAEGLVAVWDGASAGTRNMIENAEKRGLRIAVYRTDKDAMEYIEASGEMASKWEDAEERAAVLEFDMRISRADAERRAGALIAAHTYEIPPDTGASRAAEKRSEGPQQPRTGSRGGRRR